MKLAAYPKTFGLTKLEKSLLSIMLNRAEDQDYFGPMPDAKFYDPDGMSTNDREKFYAWHNHPELITETSRRSMGALVW